MGQRDDRHHHANRRRRTEKESGGRASRDEREQRAPLAGYEALYEITRSGRVFPRTTRAVLPGGYHHSAVVRIAVNGAIVTLPKAKAVADSFAALEATRQDA